MEIFTLDSMKRENLTGLTIVDFWAPWCGPCRMTAPILEALSEEYSGRVRFGKINIDEYPDAAAMMNVMNNIRSFMDKNIEE